MLLHSYILRPTRSESARARKDMHTGGPSARMRALQKRRYSVSQNSNMNLDKVMIASAPSCHVTPRVTPRPLPPLAPSPFLPLFSRRSSPERDGEHARGRASAREIARGGGDKAGMRPRGGEETREKDSDTHVIVMSTGNSRQEPRLQTRSVHQAAQMNG